MVNRSTNSWPTARVQLGIAAPWLKLPLANDNLAWNTRLFGRRVRELGLTGATSLLNSLLKYLENIERALAHDALEAGAYETIRGDLSPISRFLGFDGLSALLLNADMSAPASRHMLKISVRRVAVACTTYCATS